MSNNDGTNNERVYTHTEMENIMRSIVEQMEDERETARLSENHIPMEILEELEGISSLQLQENFRRFKKDTRKYQSNEWLVPEKINKSVLPYIKKHSTDTINVINSIQKITENTRFQARVAMEIFEELQGLLHQNPDQQQARRILEGIIESSKRLATFGLATAKAQEREAKANADKALNFPISIKHLETTEEESKAKNAYSEEFLRNFHQARFEQRLLQQSVNSYRGRGHGDFQRGRGRGNRGRGSRGSFFGSGTPNKWGHNNNYQNQQNQNHNNNNNQYSNNASQQ